VYRCARQYVTLSNQTERPGDDMKLTLLIAVGVLSIGARAQAPIALMSFQDASCGAWIESAGNEADRAQYRYWVRGFVSGHNFANPEHQVRLQRMPDNEALTLYIDKFCGDTPLLPFTSAAFQLVKELRD
jgi:hypothetical protein